MLAPPTKASQTADALPDVIPAQAGIQRGTRKTQVVPGRTGIQRGVARGSLSVQGSGERSLYPANVFPNRRTEEATALARGTNRAMTGAVLSHHASRRADGLATSAVLDTKTPTSLGKACKLSPARNPDAAMLRTSMIPSPLMGEGSGEGENPLQLNAPKNHPSPFCVSKRGTRSEANAGGQRVPVPRHEKRGLRQQNPSPLRGNTIYTSPSQGEIKRG